MSRHPLLVFVALAFGFGWSLELFGRTLGGNSGEALRVAAGLAPSLAGLGAAWLCGGRAELRALVSQALRWRVEPYWYGIALLGPVLLWWIAFAYIAAVRPYSPVDSAGFATFFPLFVSQLALGGGFGEELGWRGFLQSMLERRRSVVSASFAVGVIWALWSAPDLLLPNEGAGGVTRLLLFPGLCIAYSLIFGRVLQATHGSVLIVALLHASMNAAEPTWRAAVPSLSDSSAVSLAHAAYTLFLALVAVFARAGASAGGGERSLDDSA